MFSYASGCELPGAETEVLVVHCSDYRIQTAIGKFLRDGLHLSAYDLMAVPGGPWCLKSTAALPKFSWSGSKWFRILLRLHSLRRIILIQHQDCGWYKWLEDYEPNLGSARERQQEDLRHVKCTLTRDHPKLSVELYYAGWDTRREITMAEVPL